MKIAVVIPALDEADQVAGAIRSAGSSRGASERNVGERVADAGGTESAARDQPTESADEVEVWVVDGGSHDGTPEIALREGARVVRGASGRARQLERGWRESDGDVVLFLHADTRLPVDWAPALRAALRDEGVAGGAFRLRFEGAGWRLRVLEAGARWRVRLLGLPYGDQALFVRRCVLEQMGGIPDVEIMEDLDLVAAVKARGRLVALPLPATTSPRRYLRHGALRTAGRHFLALAAWRLGVDRRRVAQWVGR